MHHSMLTKFLIILFGGLALGFVFYTIITAVFSEAKKVGESSAALTREIAKIPAQSQQESKAQQEGILQNIVPKAEFEKVNRFYGH